MDTYEKKYNDLVNDLKELWNCHTNDSQLLGELAEICPELRESEDERIRKELVNFILYKAGHLLDEEIEHKFIAYLEKQKETLHIPGTCKENADSFTDEDERIRKAIIHYILYETKGNISEATEHVWVTWLEKQKEQKPAEWSEEDEKTINDACTFIDKYADSINKLHLTKSLELYRLSEKLKSLRPSWKPSEEQMEALQNAVALTACDKELARLYNQLKKLM